MPVLDAILAATRQTLPALRAQRGKIERTALDRPVPVDFVAALRRPEVALIAEVKRRSPSAGRINASLDPVVLAQAYARGGAAGISVLTDGPFFGGSVADLTAVADAVVTPLLRKDFILDEVQLLEARAAGASAALLIVRVLDGESLGRLLRVAQQLGLAALVETHTADEIKLAVDAGAQIIGVNARNLDTLVVDRGAAWGLLSQVPRGLVAVAESGMATPADVAAAANAGADAVLLGAALASSVDPEGSARAVSEVPRRGR